MGHGISISLNLLETAHLPKWLYHFILSSAACESASCPMSSPNLGVVSLFNHTFQWMCSGISCFTLLVA